MKKSNIIMFLIVTVMSIFSIMSVSANPAITETSVLAGLTTMDFVVTWNETVNATWWFSENSDLSSPLYTLVSNLSDTHSFNAEDLTGQSVYYYRVNATNENGTAISSIIEVRTNDFAVSNLSTRLIMGLFTLLLIGVGIIALLNVEVIGIKNLVIILIGLIILGALVNGFLAV